MFHLRNLPVSLTTYRNFRATRPPPWFRGVNLLFPVHTKLSQRHVFGGITKNECRIQHIYLKLLCRTKNIIHFKPYFSLETIFCRNVWSFSICSEKSRNVSLILILQNSSTERYISACITGQGPHTVRNWKQPFNRNWWSREAKNKFNNFHEVNKKNR